MERWWRAAILVEVACHLVFSMVLANVMVREGVSSVATIRQDVETSARLELVGVRERVTALVLLFDVPNDNACDGGICSSGLTRATIANLRPIRG